MLPVRAEPFAQHQRACVSGQLCSVTAIQGTGLGDGDTITLQGVCGEGPVPEGLAVNKILMEQQNKKKKMQKHKISYWVPIGSLLGPYWVPIETCNISVKWPYLDTLRVSGGVNTTKMTGSSSRSCSQWPRPLDL